MAEKATRPGSPATAATPREFTGRDVPSLCSGLTMRVILPNGAGFTFSLDDVARIDPDDIQAELAGQSARYAFYARLCVEMMVAVEHQKRIVEDVETTVDLRVRAEIESALEPGPRGGIPKVSETEIKRRMSLDQTVMTARLKLADLVAQEKRLQSVRETLIHRREMLAAMATFRAPEGSAGPASRAQYRLNR